MASKIKVNNIQDTGSNDIITSDGAGNITLNATLDNFTSTGIDDNATSTAITIDNSGEIGVGTSSPSAEIHISKSADAGNAEFLIENSFATAGSTDETVRIQGRFGGYDASYITTGKEADFTTSGNRSSFMSFWTRGAGTLAEAMRIDSSGNLKFNSGYGSVATAYGCRAWVNFNGTGTVAIRDSGNVSSLTDNGTGIYTVNFSTSMPDAKYAISGGVLESVANKYFRGVSIQLISSSSFQIASYRPTDGVATDVEVFTLMVAR